MADVQKRLEGYLDSLTREPGETTEYRFGWRDCREDVTRFFEAVDDAPDPLLTLLQGEVEKRRQNPWVQQTSGEVADRLQAILDTYGGGEA